MTSWQPICTRRRTRPPNGLCLKAVCGEMQQTVAYAELADIDRETLRTVSNWPSSIHHKTIATT